MSGSPRNKHRLLLAAILLLPVLTAPWWMPVMGRWLVVGENLQPADLIFVLGGDAEVRPVVGAWAYKQGLGKKILYSQPSDRFEPEVPFDPPERALIPAILRKAGVPEGDICPVQPIDPAGAILRLSLRHTVVTLQDDNETP